MTEEILTNQRFWIDGQELTGQMNQVGLDLTRMMKDRTVFGEATESFAAGIKQANVVFGGYWNAAEPDAQFHTNFNGGATAPVTIANSGTVGDPGYLLQAIQANYQITGDFGELLAFLVTVQAGESPILRGQLMFAAISTAAENGTAVQLGSVSASQRIYVAGHVTAFTGTDVIVNIESDDNSGMTTPTNQGSLTFTGIDGQFTSVAGAITDDWWRVRLSGTYTSATVAVMFGIN